MWLCALNTVRIRYWVYLNLVCLVFIFVCVKGKRPVSLIGFSLGARVIYFCLQELADDKGRNSFKSDFYAIIHYDI